MTKEIMVLLMIVYSNPAFENANHWIAAAIRNEKNRIKAHEIN